MHTLHDLSLALAHTGCLHLIRSASLASTLGAMALVTTNLGWTPGAAPDSSERAVEAVDGASCAATFEVDGSYPQLPEVEGADLAGEAGVVVHLQHHRGVVELDDCLYQLDRPLEIDFDGLDAVSVLLEIHATATTDELFVTSATTVETHPIEQPFFVFTMSPEDTLGFELAAPGQSAPTVPVVIAKPVDDGPPPK